MSERSPAIEGFFTWPTDEPYLIGSRCKSCDTYHFPKISVCSNPNCNDKGKVEEVKLSRKGELYSYSIQGYRPPPPYEQQEGDFEPFAIGLVKLPEGIKVLGMMTEKENLKVGMDVEVTVGKLYEDEKGVERLTWMFEPKVPDDE